MLTTIETLLPNSGFDRKAEMRRIAILGDVQHIAKSVWSWGLGASKTPTMEATVNYYGNSRCAPHERVLAVHDYFADFVPSGRLEDLSKYSRDDLRALMITIRDASAKQEKAVRARMSDARFLDLLPLAAE
ncbi:hypothetical protein QEZ52_00445 [Aliisedimentitalea scapharcae]|uniref:Uncharacterized protein n=1 Tax=Aliisedimentitalea scapharcae TaxID=1524259 RepID=A0ABZ2XTP7_9RHOB